MAVPGYDKSGITISLEENKLKIVGKKEESTDRKFLMKEFDFTTFQRLFYLPEDVQKDKIEATVENGILHLVIYKAEVKPAINVSIK
ncbi:MAG: Hsp20/alpha crystallin family protein [Saprospiraceae bacterium]|nr:Hsp20/alpha crystallin family protein [Saprospiraceae bacterium]